MTTIRHGGPCGLRIEMRSAERAGKSAVFLCRSAAKSLPHAQRGGYGMAQTRNAAEPLSFMSLIPLWLSPVNRPATLRTREIEKDESNPPKNRGVMRPKVESRYGVPLPGPMGSLSSSFIPAGRLGKTPFPLALHRPRIGPRRQGYASPLRALDREDRSERRAAYEEKGGVCAVGCGSRIANPSA